MLQFFRQLAQSTGLLHATADPAQSATRPIRVLLVGSIVFPVTLYLVAGAISYHQHFDDARDRLRRNLAIVHEHAQKVFETFEFSARYLDEMTDGLNDDQIRANEAMFSDRLRAMTAAMPQLRDLWIVSASGEPLVSGTVYPMPKLNVSDRDYFKVHHDHLVNGPYVTDVLDSRAANTRFFAISRKREIKGKFAGVTIVSIAPEYFSKFYSELPPPGSATLLRSDGAVLARYPDYPGAQQRLRPDAPFMTSVKTEPRTGFVTAPAAIDGRVRIFTYQQLDGLPQLYVTVGVEERDIIRAWVLFMGSHLIFGIPAILSLVVLGVIALRRTKRLQLETSRRESTEAALRQAQKMEAVGRLSGGIAHDFNNMLTIILGNIDMALRRSEENPRIHRLLDSARQASERAATLVQRLLAFSRQHPQEVKSVDINRLVQSMSELLRRTIGETVTVETVLAGGIWRVAVDANQLENAIINLAVNARDAMPDGGRLTIETSNSYLDENYVALHGEGFNAGQYVLLAITDTGVGMSREVRERAFEPFFTTKPTGMGTGLGLSMVYGFMKQSAGHVAIYSEPSEGSTIKLYFPRLSEQQSMPDWADDRGAARATPIYRGNETILLVEDDDGVRRFAADALREQGYDIREAPEAATALRMLDAEPKIRLLFTDVVLPGGMNGRQLADEARRRRPDLKVLYATGYTRNAIIHQGRLDPDVELMTKPFTIETVTRKVRQILDKPATPPTEPT
jgi:two-component system NtrC family sensor kinase